MKRALICLSLMYGFWSMNLSAQESSKSADNAGPQSRSRVPANPRVPTQSRARTFLNAQESLSPLMREVDSLLLAGNLDEAAKKIEEISEDISEESLANLRAHLARERFHGIFLKFASNDLNGSIKDCDENIRLYPKDVRAYNLRGCSKCGLDLFADALKDFDEAIRLEPKHQESYFNRGLVKSRLKDYPGAIQDYENALRLDGGGLDAGMLGGEKDALKELDEIIATEPRNQIAYFFRAVSKCRSKDYVGAIKDYDELIQLNPNAAYARFARGNTKFRALDFAGAIVDYDEALKLDPTFSAAARQRKIAAKKQSAITDYDEALRLNPNNASNYITRGNAKSERKDYAGAIKDYDEVITLPEENNRFGAGLRQSAISSRASIKRDAKDFAGAIKDYDELIRLSPNNAGYYISRGHFKESSGDYIGAINDFDEAIRLSPNEVNYYSSRGSFKHRSGDLIGAIKDFDEVVRLGDRSPNAYFMRGYAKRDAKDYKGALEDWDEVIRLDPKAAAGYNNRGQLKRLMHDYKGAIEDHDQSIRLNFDLPHSYGFRGSAKSRLKDYAEAVADFDEALKRDPESKFFKASKAFLLATVADSGFRDAEAALRLAEDVLSKDGTDPYALNAKACALAAKGEFIAAIELQSKIDDKNWLEDEEVEGGVLAPARIAAWKLGMQWHP